MQGRLGDSKNSIDSREEFLVLETTIFVLSLAELQAKDKEICRFCCLIMAKKL